MRAQRLLRRRERPHLTRECGQQAESGGVSRARRVSSRTERDRGACLASVKQDRNLCFHNTYHEIQRVCLLPFFNNGQNFVTYSK